MDHISSQLFRWFRCSIVYVAVAASELEIASAADVANSSVETGSIQIRFWICSNKHH